MRHSLDAAEDLAALSLACTVGVTREHCDALKQRFVTLANACAAPLTDLVVSGLSVSIAERVARRVACRDGQRAAERALAACERLGIRLLLPHHEDWPTRIDRVTPRPMALYLRGSVPAECVAVVGSRRADVYGLRFARALGRDLAKAGLCVVSGAALGIDGAAHVGALDAHVPHPTLAVLGCGVDVGAPPRRRELFAALSRHGALLSELPPGTPPLPHHFPERNRLIAALASAVVVVRATQRSGSLITARWGRTLGIPVLATPGPAGDALSAGTHELLRSGAPICASVEDVLVFLRRQTAESPPKQTRPSVPDLDSGAANLLELLSSSPTTLDELGAEVGMESGSAAAMMTRLELMGLAERRGSGFVRTS